MSKSDQPKTYTEKELEEKLTDLSATHDARITDLSATYDARLRDLQCEIDRHRKAAVLYSVVRQNKSNVLQQMLNKRFDIVIQPLLFQAADAPTVIKETNPDKVAAMAIHWMSYHHPERVNHCDDNARFCFATVHVLKI